LLGASGRHDHADLQLRPPLKSYSLFAALFGRSALFGLMPSPSPQHPVHGGDIRYPHGSLRLPCDPPLLPSPALVHRGTRKPAPQLLLVLLDRSKGFLYTYDLDGNLLSRSYPNALKTSYSYNDASEMVTATVKGKTTRYSHDANGNLVSTLHPSGILDERSYDAAGRLTGIKGTGSHRRLFYSRSYSYDAAGNPLTLEAAGPREHSHGWWGNVLLHEGEALAKWTETYSYDSLNRLTKACMNESCSHYYSYSYDPVGNRTKLETKKSETSYTYDAADELTSASKLEHRRTEVTSYAYDLNGNETQEGSTHYSYNLENKLAQVVDKHEKVSYSYTGEGLMNTRSTHSETTSYSWDTSSELPELALETTSKGQGRHGGCPVARRT
jgi:YD repeat-containing protein